MKTEKKKNIDKIKELLEQEENETIIAETLEYVKVLWAFNKLARKPPSPEIWARLSRWRQLQIVLISELFYQHYLLKTWLSDQREKGWLL
jgi:hypothetical protein